MTTEIKNGMDAMVSICCLAYNHEKYIRKTLEGFISQKTNFKYEVLIHDDASTDGTRGIIEEYQKKYPDIIKPVFQKENQYSKGVNVTFEYQYPRVKGKYVCWCEGDDYWCDEYKLQMQFDILEENIECSACVHKVQCINEDGSVNERVIPENYYKINQGIIDEETICKAFWIRGGYPFHTSSLFVKKSVIDRLLRARVPTFNYFNGDINILRASMCEGKFYYLDSILSKRRLFSIGNWNSSYMKWPLEKKVDFAKKQLHGEVAFNVYTNDKYVEYIKVAMAENIISWCEYDIKGAKLAMKENQIALKTFDKVEKHSKLKEKLHYFCLFYCPFLLKVKHYVKGVVNSNG